jgi:hypothetical protein
MTRGNLSIIAATAVFAAMVAAVYAQDKYSLVSPGGIAFSPPRAPTKC